MKKEKIAKKEKFSKKQRMLKALGIIFLLSVCALNSGTVRAAGDPHWSGTTGPSGPMPIQPSAHEQLVAQLKQRFLQEVPPGGLPSPELRAQFLEAGIVLADTVRTPGPMQHPPRTASGAIDPDYAGANGWYYTTVDAGPNVSLGVSANTYQEPMIDPIATHTLSFYANMCGPGSATKVLSHWNIPQAYSGARYRAGTTSRAQGYMLDLAIDQNMMKTDDPLHPGVWNTSPYDEANIMNGVLFTRGFGWLYLWGMDRDSDDHWGDTLGHWSSVTAAAALSFDIQAQGVPSVLNLDARAISSAWAALYPSPVNHLVAVNGYNPGTAGTPFPTPSAEIFDSAGPADGAVIDPSDSPLGFRSLSLDRMSRNPTTGVYEGFYDQIW